MYKRTRDTPQRLKPRGFHSLHAKRRKAHPPAPIVFDLDEYLYRFSIRSGIPMF